MLATLMVVTYVGLVRRGDCPQANNMMRVNGLFSDVDGIKVGSDIFLAGIKVGQVCGMVYQPKDHKTEIQMMMRNDLNLADDSSFSIVAYGLNEPKVINISAGGSLGNLSDGGTVTYTNGAVAIEKLFLLVLERAEAKVGLKK